MQNLICKIIIINEVITIFIIICIKNVKIFLWCFANLCVDKHLVCHYAQIQKCFNNCNIYIFFSNNFFISYLARRQVMATLTRTRCPVAKVTGVKFGKTEFSVQYSFVTIPLTCIYLSVEITYVLKNNHN